MKMKKVLAVLLVVAIAAALCVSVVACGNEEEIKPISKENIKIGLICLHGESSTYDKNFIDAMKEAKQSLGLNDDQVVIVQGVGESQDCYDAAANLVDKGCNVIFADSFGHESFMIEAAKEFPNVQFCHATGTKAHTEKLSNYHNAFASIYEGRYLAGVAAGLKLNEMIAAGKFKAGEAKMGYVGAHPYAEVVSGYTSFYLGAKSVCPTVTMDVKYTKSWYDEPAEKETAEYLIQNGCKLISQHADSWGAPKACEAKNVPNVSYNGSTVSQCPNTAIISSKINWAPYYEYVVNCMIKGEKINPDWTGTLSTGSVVLTDVNEAVAAKGTAEKIAAVKAKLINGEIKVFDTANFTVGGKKLTTYMADVDTDPAYTGDTEAIENGIFEESKFRSAPYFDVRIDGITEIENKK